MASTIHSPGAGPDTTLRRASLRRRHARRTAVAWLFALPFVLIFAVFMLWPLVGSFLMSFTDIRSRDLPAPFAVGFVGLGQYASLLSNPDFLRSMLNTAYFVLVGIPLTMVVALVLAVALNSRLVRLRSVFRVGFYTPVITSIVAIAVVWRFILQPDGLLNVMLGWFGIEGPNWLQSTTWAMPAMILMAVWRNVGTLMIIFLAGLQNVPEEVLEAAEVDGAGAVRRFFSITVPILRPTLLLGAVLLSVGFLQFFEEPFVMTQGGPLNSTLSVSYFTFNQFGFGNYGTASAASYMLFIVIALVNLLQFRLFRSKD